MYKTRNYYGRNYIVESSLSKILQHSDNGFFIISSYRGEYSEEENYERLLQLKEKIKSYGLGYITLIGGFPETDRNTGIKEPKTELPLFVPFKNKIEISIEDFKQIAVSLCKAFEQESVLWCDPETKIIGFLDSDGNISGNLGKFSIYKMGDYWSQLRRGTKSHISKKFVFEGYRYPVGGNGTRMAELEGEIIGDFLKITESKWREQFK